MKKLLYCILTLSMAFTASIDICAKKENFFLDAKSHLVGIATIGGWREGDLYEKFVVTKMDPDISVDCWDGISHFPSNADMSSYLNKRNAGRLVIDRLLGFDGTRLDDTELRRRALLNANRRDKERAEKHLIDASSLLQDDLDPILMHNFLFVRLSRPTQVTDKDGKTKTVTEYGDYLYKVDMTHEILEKIYAAWEDPDAYRDIYIPLRRIYTPKASEYENISTLTTALEKTSNDFMLYGQLLSRSSIDLPESLGIRRGDDVTIYRQEIDRKGRPYSRRIARGKVNGFDKNGTQTHFFRLAANAGSKKNGDVATTSHPKYFSFAVMGEYSEHNWGVNFKMDHPFGFRKSGLYSHFLFNLGAAITDKPGENFEYESQSFDAPWFMNMGLGWGIGKTFIGLFDIMPYFMAQYDGVLMSKSDSDDDTKDIIGHYVRVPLGVRLNVNIVYPVRLSLEAGYAFRFNLSDPDKGDFIDESCDYLNVKRNGIFLSAGLYF